MRGVQAPKRPHTRNALVFMRNDRTNLQQMHIKNRSHHRHVLILALEVAGTVIIDGIEARLPEGQAMLVLPYQFHHYVNLDAERLRWLFITFETSESSASLDSLSHTRLKPNEEELTLWARIAQRWIADSNYARDETLPLLDLLLMKMHARVAKPATVNTLRQSNNSWIAQVESLLRQAVDENWTLQEVARRCRISERHLRSRFNAECGVSIREYRANYQLHRAQILMRDTPSSFAEIAERVGFQSSSSFSRFISRETGMTPMELRKTLS